MTPERWQRVKEILGDTLELDPAEWSSFIATACEDDETLKGDVEALLESETAVQGFIEKPAFSLHSGNRKESGPGKRLGPYRILKEIDHGGMGTIYLAQRQDDYQKEVAIKLLKRGLDTEDLVRRFAHERQILAGLDHPNIARLLDGGTTADGRPYLVMEYVEGGKPIDEYCDTRKLGITARLRLFRSVCSAVHYAHQNLVVHRDLKPGNLLVTPDGTPKLLDFGIAKLLDPDRSSHTTLAAVGLRAMTPEYASPEQIRGEAITTASDVYSLGVLLYKLLTGRYPYPVENRGQEEITKIVCEEEPQKPSTAVRQQNGRGTANGATGSPKPASRSQVGDGDPHRLRRRLLGDLDNILLKALRKEPERRYSSVERFAEDLRRHLEGFPVLARRDGTLYRLGKFVRRHRVAVVATTVAIAVVMVLLAITFAIKRDQAQMARIYEESERKSRQTMLSLVVELFEQSSPIRSEGKELTAREVLERARVEVPGSLQEHPQARATLLGTLGQLHRRLGLYEEARELLQESLRIRRETPGIDPPEVAKSLHSLGLLLLDLEDVPAAASKINEAVDIQRRHYREDHPELARGLNVQATLLRRQEKYEDAVKLHREALAMRHRLYGGEHPEIATSLQNLALVYYKQENYFEAESLYRQALAMRRRLLGPLDEDVATTASNLAVLLQANGENQQADDLLREAIQIRQKLFGDEHPKVASSLYIRARLFQAMSRYDEAKSLYEEAIRIQSEKRGPMDPRLARYMTGLGSLLCHQGDPAAIPTIGEAIEVLREVKPEWLADAERISAECPVAVP